MSGRKERVPSVVLVLIFIVLAAGIIAAGALYYRNYKQNFRLEVEHRLSAIAELKVNELANWRTERLAGAALFYKNDAFSVLVRRFFEKPYDPAGRDQLQTWLARLKAIHEYDRVFLLDAAGAARLSVPDTTESVAAHLLEQAPEILRSGRITILDFHRDAPDRPIHLSILVPILDVGDDDRAMGILVLRIDPEKYLYPYLNRWPTPSRTAESLLIRRDGNDALFLNELRFRKETALTLRVPLTQIKMPAVQAALGQEGIVEGLDYRGVPVVAYVRGVPESPWFLVARMDVSEVYMPLRERLLMMIVVVGSLLLGAGMGVGFIWRQERLRYFRAKVQADEEILRKAKELQEKNAELERFTYAVSHDLKSPLITIHTFLGYLEQDARKPDRERLDEDLRYLHAASDKMSRLLDELLEFSRIGRMVNPLVEAPLQEIANEALVLVAGSIAERGIKVEVTKMPILLHGDRPRLIEVFQNLVENAVKFRSDRAAPLVEIGAEQAGEEIVLFVRDNGMGIDPKHQPKIFGLFEKLNPGTEGDGISLALVKRIVELHGGRIWVESEGMGKGAAFRFTLASTKLARGGEDMP